MRSHIVQNHVIQLPDNARLVLGAGSRRVEWRGVTVEGMETGFASLAASRHCHGVE